jgi:hypothetical protein
MPLGFIICLDIPHLSGITYRVTALTPVGVTPIMALTDTAIRNAKPKDKAYSDVGLFLF